MHDDPFTMHCFKSAVYLRNPLFNYLHAILVFIFTGIFGSYIVFRYIATVILSIFTSYSRGLRNYGMRQRHPAYHTCNSEPLKGFLTHFAVQFPQFISPLVSGRPRFSIYHLHIFIVKRKPPE
jgi:hypothetical protein